MFFLAKLILKGLTGITNFHICNVSKVTTGQILGLYISSGLIIFTCKVNINLFFVAFD